MTQSNHTQWRISVDGDGYIDIRTGKDNSHPDSDLIASVHDAQFAHLIATAPDLLQALKNMLVILDAAMPIKAGNYAEDDWLDIMKAHYAIAKAEGE